jgi:DNA-binding NarL/FixJ family response regulator
VATVGVGGSACARQGGTEGGSIILWSSSTVECEHPKALAGMSPDPAVIRVLVIDDHPTILEGVRLTLESAPDITVASVAVDGATARTRFRSTRPDVVIMDYSLPDTDGISLTRDLKAVDPGTRVLLLTASDNASIVERAVRSGCDGFLSKTATPGEIIDAVRRLNAGEALFDVALLIRAVREEPQQSSPTELSTRELAVLRLVARGSSTEVVASELYVSVNTVRSHVRRILEKLGAHSKLEAVAIAVRDGTLAPEDFAE